MNQTVGIAGAGVLGRLLALKGQARGWNITLFDRDGTGASACSSVAPAMLAPWCELDTCEKEIAALGADSVDLWEHILRQFGLPVFFQREGTLVVAHPTDREELARFKRNVSIKAQDGAFEEVSGDALRSLEPQLDQRFQSGLYFPDEGQVDSRGFLAATNQILRQRGVECRFGEEIQEVQPNQVRAGSETLPFDVVLDCRGLGAAGDLPDLRAVRGEIIHLEAPDVHLNRPVRLLHPRYPLYVVPRPQNRYILGATSIESEDKSPISVRSTLELLSAAYALHAGFSEARITETVTGLRPAFPDNIPRITHRPGLIRVNGLYRHGYLLSPKLSDEVWALVESGQSAVKHADLLREAA